MSDGATTPISQQTQCPNCSGNDSIVIAGKTFCGNCGNPQPTKDGSGDNVPLSTPPVPNLQASTSVASGSSPAGPMSEKMPASTDAVSAAGFTSSNQAVGPAAEATVPTVAPAQSSQPNVPSVQGNSSSAAINSEALHIVAPSTEPPSIQKYSMGPANYDTFAKSDGPSEIESLNDDNEETVMSDSALAELSKANDIPVPTGEEEAFLNGITSHISPPAPSLVGNGEALAPQASSYMLDLTKPRSTTLPKAVSDIRPGSGSSQATSAPISSSSTTPQQSTQPVSGATQATSVAATTSGGSSPAAKAPSPNSPIATNSSAVPPSTNPLPIVNAPTPLQAVRPPVAPPPTAPISVVSAPQQPAVASVAAQNIESNTAAAVSKTGVKASSVALSFVGLLLVGAYIWQVNYPNLALKVAGSKAGISANFPGYIPNGWKLSGNIISSPGNISYNIAGQKGESLVVTESKTNWDSQALAENYVSPKSADYLALQSQGLTIYIYNGNQASWVNNGNWYRLEGSAKSLTQDQVIKIATSL